MKPSATTIAAIAWIAGAATFLICEAVAASSVPGYSYLDDVISDLGAHGRLRALMNVGFVVHGMLLLVGAMVVRATHRRAFVGAAAVNALGNVAVALAHSNSTQSWIHVIGAAAAIVGGNVAVILGAGIGGMPGWWRAVSVAMGGFGLMCAVAIGLAVGPSGAVERAAVYPIVAWELIGGALLLTQARALWSDD